MALGAPEKTNPTTGMVCCPRPDRCYVSNWGGDPPAAGAPQALSSGTPAPNQIGAGFTAGMWNVNNVIDALAADQLITILAEPNLTAQSGETASFLAGGEFPIPVQGNGSNGTVQITVEFKSFGVSLALVPTVLSPTRLNLRIRPEVSELSTQGEVTVSGFVIPALTVRRAETTVNLASGESFALAGLMQHTTEQDVSKIPWIGDIPILGALFRSNKFQNNESELVILVTPYLVKPVRDRSVATPLDRPAPVPEPVPVTAPSGLIYK